MHFIFFFDVFIFFLGVGDTPKCPFHFFLRVFFTQVQRVYAPMHILFVFFCDFHLFIFCCQLGKALRAGIGGFAVVIIC